MSDVRIIVGKRGFGKSHELRKMLLAQPRVVVYDTLHEKLYDKFTRIESFPRLCSELQKNPAIFRIAYSWNGDCDREIDFERVCQAVYCCRSLTFAIEEVDQFCHPSWIPRHLDMLVSLGRHRDISVWVASRRPKEINPTIRAQANQVVTFAQIEEADIEWLRQVIGERADGLRTLPKRKKIVWTDDEQENPPAPLTEQTPPVVG